jgi:hypothetical protein
MPAMLFRFSLYGFLKNLRLFDAFLILALLERDLGFAAIGGLIAVRAQRRIGHHERVEEVPVEDGCATNRAVHGGDPKEVLVARRRGLPACT